MSGRFVSTGAVDANGAGTVNIADAGESKNGSVKNQQWEAARRQLEEERKQREEARVKAASGEEKSLYEVLQANKAAKEAAFEEKNKIANQFLTLDDHDVEFLDEIREKQRKEEREKKKELEDGLKAFREAQKDGGGGGRETEKDVREQEGEGEQEETWAVGKKRRRVKERDIKGVRRKVEGERGEEKTEVKIGEAKTGEQTAVPSTASKPESTMLAPAATTGLGLVAYGSDSDSN